jgi:hypothetical protein
MTKRHRSCGTPPCLSPVPNYSPTFSTNLSSPCTPSDTSGMYHAPHIIIQHSTTIGGGRHHATHSPACIEQLRRRARGARPPDCTAARDRMLLRAKRNMVGITPRRNKARKMQCCLGTFGEARAKWHQHHL